MSVQALMEKLTTQLTSSFGSTVNLNMGDDGMVHIDGNQTPPTISLGHADADGTINMSLENFMALADGTLDPMGAFMDGTLSIDGDMGAVMALQSSLTD